MMKCPVAATCRAFGYDCLDCCGGLPLEDAVNSTLRLFYKKLSPTDPDHPVVAARQEKRDQAKEAERRRRQSDIFKKKSRMTRRAFKTERETRSDIIRATQRSGAVNGDGDSRIGSGRVGIDDKLQSKATKQITLKTEEIDKAHRQGCIVVITTSTGRKFVVAELDFFIRNLDALQELSNKQK
jgi:hypothetical protein